ncbi:MAG: SH3 domain-containing protein [Chloroflexi bacterium]|nr:SH3 domain-containing protein [Chloroflexota bacterium]
MQAVISPTLQVASVVTGTMPPQPTRTNTYSPTRASRPTASATSAATETNPPSNVYSTYVSGTVRAARLNVRRTANPSSYIVFRLSEGETVRLIAKNSSGTWFQVDVGVIGWVSADWIQPNQDTSRLRVVSGSEPLPVSQVRLRFSCSGAYGPHFKIGDRYVVPVGDGPTSVWTDPNGPPRVTRVPERSEGIILGGPICTGGQRGNLVWWYVRTDSGHQGYVSEGYPDSRVPWIEPTS